MPFKERRRTAVLGIKLEKLLIMGKPVSRRTVAYAQSLCEEEPEGTRGENALAMYEITKQPMLNDLL
jgi:hypothetical protein